jgi:competence protein ComEC
VAPLVAFYFHRFSTYFLISNFVVIPCAYLILMGALLLFITRLSVLATALTAITTFMHHTLDAIATLPYASIDIHPNLSQTILIYAFIGCLYIICLQILPVRPDATQRFL